VNNGEVKIKDALRGLDISVLFNSAASGDAKELMFSTNESGHLADGIEPVTLLCTSLPREDTSATEQAFRSTASRPLCDHEDLRFSFQIGQCRADRRGPWTDLEPRTPCR
jgi:hypothetical protein